MDVSNHAVHGGASFDAIGSAFEHLDRRHEVINADVLDAWYDPSPNVVAAIREHLPWLIKTSPPTHSEGLRSVISATRGIPEANILLGPGSSTLMFSVIPTLVGPSATAAILDPMYGEYEHILSKVIGAKVARYALSPETGFIPVAKELADVASGSQLIALVNPNSPTGVCVGHAFFETLLSSISPETWVWVDETYIDMAPGQPSIETWVPRYPRLIVSKSMSKFYALSGVRVGYLAASAELVSRMESTIPPWDIGLIAQVAAVEALRDDAYYSAKTEETARYRDAFFSELQSIPGLSPVRSDTNFILIRLDKPVAAALCSSTAEVDVFLRDCDSLSEWFGGHYVRTAVKTPDENAKIVAAIRRFFQ